MPLYLPKTASYLQKFLGNLRLLPAKCHDCSSYLPKPVISEYTEKERGLVEQVPILSYNIYLSEEGEKNYFKYKCIQILNTETISDFREMCQSSIQRKSIHSFAKSKDRHTNAISTKLFISKSCTDYINGVRGWLGWSF